MCVVGTGPRSVHRYTTELLLGVLHNPRSDSIVRSARSVWISWTRSGRSPELMRRLECVVCHDVGRSAKDIKLLMSHTSKNINFRDSNIWKDSCTFHVTCDNVHCMAVSTKASQTFTITMAADVVYIRSSILERQSQLFSVTKPTIHFRFRQSAEQASANAVALRWLHGLIIIIIIITVCRSENIERKSRALKNNLSIGSRLQTERLAVRDPIHYVRLPVTISSIYLHVTPAKRPKLSSGRTQPHYVCCGAFESSSQQQRFILSSSIKCERSPIHRRAHEHTTHSQSNVGETAMQ